jgi:hypothetical protein
MHMNMKQAKSRVVLAWVVMTTLFGLASGTTSMATWTMLVALALIPSLVVMHFWGSPEQSTSERIRDAIR